MNDDRPDPASEGAPIEPASTPPPLPPLHPDAQPAPIPSIPYGRAPRLREMRIGELLDASINLYRGHWKLFMGIVASVFVPLQFLQSFLTRAVTTAPFTRSTPENLPAQSDVSHAAVIGGIFAGLIILIVLPFLTAAIARATSEVYLGGSPGVGDIYRFALSRTAAVLWVTFLVFVITTLGFIALIIPGIIFLVRYSFSTAVVAVEGTRGTRAMKRSWFLSKGYFWKILGTIFLAGILTSIVGGILQIPLAIVASRMGTSGWVLRAIGGSAASIVTRPFTVIVVVLLYFDMRIRKEGFDLALMAQEIAGRPQI